MIWAALRIFLRIHFGGGGGGGGASERAEWIWYSLCKVKSRCQPPLLAIKSWLWNGFVVILGNSGEQGPLLENFHSEAKQFVSFKKQTSEGQVQSKCKGNKSLPRILFVSHISLPKSEKNVSSWNYFASSTRQRQQWVLLSSEQFFDEELESMDAKYCCS